MSLEKISSVNDLDNYLKRIQEESFRIIRHNDSEKIIRLLGERVELLEAKDSSLSAKDKLAIHTYHYITGFHTKYYFIRLKKEL